MFGSSAGIALRWLVEAYVIVLIARALMSWFPVHPGTPTYQIVRLLDRLTEPVLRPIRSILPPLRAGGMAIDLSIIVAVIALQVVAQVLVNRV